MRCRTPMAGLFNYACLFRTTGTGKYHRNYHRKQCLRRERERGKTNMQAWTQDSIGIIAFKLSRLFYSRLTTLLKRSYGPPETGTRSQKQAHTAAPCSGIRAAAPCAPPAPKLPEQRHTAAAPARKLPSAHSSGTQRHQHPGSKVHTCNSSYA